MKNGFDAAFILTLLLIPQIQSETTLKMQELQSLRRIYPSAGSNTKGFSKNDTKEVSELWENYYSCQKYEYQNMLNRHSTTENIALPVFEGSHVNMSCKVCLSPRQNGNDISWYIILNKNLRPLNITGAELHFSNVAIEQQGVYACKFTNLVRKMFWVHVLYEPNEPIQEVKLKDEPKAKEVETIESDMGEIEIFSDWSAWSNCSEKHNCGHVGRRIKHGPCMLSIKNASKFEKEQRTTLQLFPQGLPCRSPLVPLKIRSIKQIQDRPSEIIIGYCKVPCSTSPDNEFKVWDSKGNLVDNVDNAAGLFSSLQDIPKPPLPAARVYLFPYDGDSLIIKCPGNKESDSPVQWHKGHKYIHPGEVKKSTEGRITISVLRHLIFKELHLKDTNVYSCWQEGRLVGSVKVQVMTRDVVMSKLHWSLFMAVAVLSSVLLAIYRIYKSDK